MWRKRRRQPRSPPRADRACSASATCPQAGPPPAAGEPAARAHRLSGPLRLPQVRRPGPQAGRGRHRDARVRAAALEGGRARAGEGLLPLVRGGQPAAGPLASDRPWASRAQPAGPGAGGEVRPAPAADPAECDLRPRGGRDRRLHAGRLGRRCGCQPDAAGRGDPGARLRGRAAARRRHHGPGAGQGADQDRPLVGLRPRRPPLRRARSAGGGVLLLARSRGHPPRAPPGRVRGHPAGGRLWRVQPALRARPEAGPDPRGRLLGPCPKEAVRAGRDLEGADRGRGGAAHRSAVRGRARHRRPERRGTAGGTTRSARHRSWPTSSPGCGSSRNGSRASRRSARRSPTRPGAGKRSPGS